MAALIHEIPGNEDHSGESTYYPDVNLIDQYTLTNLRTESNPQRSSFITITYRSIVIMDSRTSHRIFSETVTYFTGVRFFYYLVFRCFCFVRRPACKHHCGTKTNKLLRSLKALIKEWNEFLKSQLYGILIHLMQWCKTYLYQNLLRLLCTLSLWDRHVWMDALQPHGHKCSYITIVDLVSLYIRSVPDKIDIIPIKNKYVEWQDRCWKNNLDPLVYYYLTYKISFEHKQ